MNLVALVALPMQVQIVAAVEHPVKLNMELGEVGLIKHVEIPYLPMGSEPQTSGKNGSGVSLRQLGDPQPDGHAALHARPDVHFSGLRIREVVGPRTRQIARVDIQSAGGVNALGRRDARVSKADLNTRRDRWTWDERETRYHHVRSKLFLGRILGDLNSQRRRFRAPVSFFHSVPCGPQSLPYQPGPHSAQHKLKERDRSHEPLRIEVGLRTAIGFCIALLIASVSFVGGSWLSAKIRGRRKGGMGDAVGVACVACSVPLGLLACWWGLFGF